jgi:hypothetical protein
VHCCFCPDKPRARPPPNVYDLVEEGSRYRKLGRQRQQSAQTRASRLFQIPAGKQSFGLPSLAYELAIQLQRNSARYIIRDRVPRSAVAITERR